MSAQFVLLLSRITEYDGWDPDAAQGPNPHGLLAAWQALQLPGVSVNDLYAAHQEPVQRERLARYFAYLFPGLDILEMGDLEHMHRVTFGGQIIHWSRAFWRLIYSLRRLLSQALTPVIALEVPSIFGWRPSDTQRAREALTRWLGGRPRSPSFDAWAAAVEHRALGNNERW